MGKEVVNATSETNSRGPSFDNLQDAAIAYDPRWIIQSASVVLIAIPSLRPKSSFAQLPPLSGLSHSHSHSISQASVLSPRYHSRPFPQASLLRKDKQHKRAREEHNSSSKPLENRLGRKSPKNRQHQNNNPCNQDQPQKGQHHKQSAEDLQAQTNKTATILAGSHLQQPHKPAVKATETGNTRLSINSSRRAASKRTKQLGREPHPTGSLTNKRQL
ncbi:hypothetical protein Peur_037042 [Populus x canadensis]